MLVEPGPDDVRTARNLSESSPAAAHRVLRKLRGMVAECDREVKPPQPDATFPPSNWRELSFPRFDMFPGGRKHDTDTPVLPREGFLPGHHA